MLVSSMLEWIERTHPEWLRHAVPSTPAPGGASFMLRLPSPDRCPDVEVSGGDREAIVRVGRHERLFVWPPDDANDAAAEVIDYVERVTRTEASAGPLGSELARLEEDLLAYLGIGRTRSFHRWWSAE